MRGLAEVVCPLVPLPHHYCHLPPYPHVPPLLPLSLDFLFLCASLILIPGTLSHSLFLYVYDLNDSDLGLQSVIFLLIFFLLFENYFVIHYNSRLFLLILVFFFHANMLQLNWAYLEFLAFMCSIAEKFVEIEKKYKVLTFSGIELDESE